jgi:hypothetical protein
VRLAPLLLVLFLGCGDAASAPVELRDLVLQDSTYFEPTTLAPFTGPIFSTFLTDPERIQIEGALLDGTWDGEFRVYHRDGRIRYEGSFERGVRCGAWTENTDPRPPSNIYDELVTVIETLAMYPPCSDGGAGGG